MSFFPDFKTFITFDIGSFHLQITWYAVLILSGAILAYYLSVRNAKKIGYDKEILEDFFIYMMPLAILGARVWYVLFNIEILQSNPLRIFYIWEGGLAIHGGLITGVTFAFFYFRHYGVNVLRIADCAMPNVLLAQMIGRWGNFMNQEAFGEIVSEAYFDHFPAFIKNHMYINGFYRQPMFLYEGIGNLIGFLLITFVYKKHGQKKRGDLLYAYIAWYGLVRFFIEMFRTDAMLIGDFKIARIVSVVFMVVGLLGMLGVYNKLFKNKYPFKVEKPAVLFDADGTIIDTYSLIKESFIYTFSIHKPEYKLSEEELDSFVGPTLVETFSKYFDASEVDTVIKTYRDYNHANHQGKVSEIKNAHKLLTYLKENDYPIAVVSNKFKEAVLLGLKVSDLDAFFDVVVCGDEVEKAKPSPEGILKACELLKVPHDDLIYVGDSEVDVLAAKNMGAFSIALVSSSLREEALRSTKPSRIIYDLIEIEDILKEDHEWNDLMI